uniref:hypothetical protein n=1 Tax=Streptomyces sp. MSC1_001 TaxID=2909263 RepID=UPI00202DBE83
MNTTSPATWGYGRDAERCEASILHAGRIGANSSTTSSTHPTATAASSGSARPGSVPTAKPRTSS